MKTQTQMSSSGDSAIQPPKAARAQADPVDTWVLNNRRGAKNMEVPLAVVSLTENQVLEKVPSCVFGLTLT